MTASDPRLERWLESVLGTPGLTAVRDPGKRGGARRGALAVAALVTEGPVVDVGSGGGSPGMPVALARPDLRVDLLEAQRRKCDFLEVAARDLANVSVVCARAEEHGRGAGRDAYGTALAQALAPAPVALEWCLPLCGLGRVILLAGDVDLAARQPRPRPGRGARSLSVVRNRPRRLLGAEGGRRRNASRAAPAQPGNVLWPD